MIMYQYYVNYIELWGCILNLFFINTRFENNQRYPGKMIVITLP